MDTNIIPQIVETTYKGLAAISLETELMKVIVVPEIGAKIVSLLYKPTQKEWLLDSGQRPLHALEEGAAFAESDMSGWDECFPTINACNYPLPGEFNGRVLADHGEVWSIPWDVTISKESLILKVAGRSLPYILQRTMRFIAPNVMRLEYEATNLSDEDLAVIWTAHPQFAATPDMKIVLPAEIKQMSCVYGGNNLVGNETLYDWPIATLSEGNKRLDILDFDIEQDSRKFYYAEQVPAGWSGLFCSLSEDYLILEVDRDEVPYLGIWMDEKTFNDRVTCALEPSSGFYDSLSLAVENKKHPIVKANSTLTWQLDIKLGKGKQAQLNE